MDSDQTKQPPSIEEAKRSFTIVSKWLWHWKPGFVALITGAVTVAGGLFALIIWVIELKSLPKQIRAEVDVKFASLTDQIESLQNLSDTLNEIRHYQCEDRHDLAFQSFYRFKSQHKVDLLKETSQLLLFEGVLQSLIKKPNIKQIGKPDLDLFNKVLVNPLNLDKCTLAYVYLGEAYLAIQELDSANKLFSLSMESKKKNLEKHFLAYTYAREMASRLIDDRNGNTNQRVSVAWLILKQNETHHILGTDLIYEHMEQFKSTDLFENLVSRSPLSFPVAYDCLLEKIDKTEFVILEVKVKGPDGKFKIERKQEERRKEQKFFPNRLPSLKPNPC